MGVKYGSPMRLIVGARGLGVAVGPVAGLLLLVGWLFYAALLALGVVAIGLVVVAGRAIDWASKRRRRSVATPRPAPGVEPWVRGHREITATEQAIMGRR